MKPLSPKQLKGMDTCNLVDNIHVEEVQLQIADSIHILIVESYYSLPMNYLYTVQSCEI